MDQQAPPEIVAMANTLIEKYVEAVNAADADQLSSLFWLDDERFSDIENHIPNPFGKKVFDDISDWIRKNAKPGDKQRFFDTRVYQLSPEVVYSTSLREELDPVASVRGATSRITFIYLRKEGTWKIIHGHFSYVLEN